LSGELLLKLLEGEAGLPMALSSSRRFFMLIANASSSNEIAVSHLVASRARSSGRPSLFFQPKPAAQRRNRTPDTQAGDALRAVSRYRAPW